MKLSTEDYEHKALQVASGEMLTKIIPEREEWEKMSDYEMDAFVVDNAWEPFENWPAGDVWSQIDQIKGSILSFARGNQEVSE